MGDGYWTVETRIPLENLGLTPDQPFSLSLGFFLRDLGHKRIVLQNHPAWFDHFQAFNLAHFVPVSARIDLGHLAQGQVDVRMALRNAGEQALTGAGSYLIATPDIQESVRDWDYDQLIGEEIEVAVRGLMHRWQAGFALETAGATVLTDAYRLAQPGTYLIRAEATLNGQPIYRQTLPFVYYSPLDVTLKPVHGQQRIKALAAFYGVDLGAVREIVFRVPRADGGVAAHRFPVAARKADYALPMGDMAPGPHEIEAALVDAAGAEFAARRLPFEKWPDPAWLTNPVGLDALAPDWVPPPWTPITADGLTFSVWGRTFSYANDAVLPVMTSQDVTLNSRPATLRYRIGAETHAITIGETRVTETHQGRVQIVQTGTAPHFDYTAEHVLEFDGLTRIRLTLTPKGTGLRVDELSLDMPLDVARYYNSHRYNLGLVADEAFDKINFLWLGDDQVGFEWMTESYRGWRIHSQKPRVTVRRAEGLTHLRMMIVNEPAVLDQPLSLEFGLQPTPLKPLPEGFRDWRFSTDGSGKNVNLWSPHFARWNSAMSKPTPRTWQVFEDMVAYGREHGKRLYPFMAPFYISRYDMIKGDVPFYVHPRDLDRAYDGPITIGSGEPRPTVAEAFYFAADWDIEPPYSQGRSDEGTLHYCSPSSSYADYFVYSIEQLLVRGLDGLYMDLAGPRENFDPAQGFAYETLDGQREGTLELFAARDLYKRLYYIFEAHRGQENLPYMLGHAYPVGTAYRSFWSLCFHGEGFKPSARFDYTQWYLQTELRNRGRFTASDPEAERSFEAIAYRLNYPQQQLGIPMMVLPQYSKGAAGPAQQVDMGKDPALARELLSFTFLHDHLLWPSRINAAVADTFWREVEMAYALGEAQFHPYWSNGVRSAPASVKVSYWTKPGARDVLVAVANWDAQAVAARIELPAGLADSLTWVDMESGAAVAGADGFTVSVPAHDLRVLRGRAPTPTDQP
ncbi:MAG: DUF6067 family protein [Candidatus Marinimicrobia bacterium]|nr:DUF6067 family protein [Candidatus Neomarinimicrobiota bacterium]